MRELEKVTTKKELRGVEGLGEGFTAPVTLKNVVFSEFISLSDGS